jgi:putative two-component system response regulator
MEPNGTILIVDDDEAGRKGLEGLMIPLSFDLLFAADGPECLAQADKFHPDLILLDVMMPEMDGYEVCRRLRADPILAEVPILMLTALDDREARLAGLEAGADDFITKPYDRAELRSRVRTIMRLNRYRKLRDEHIRLEAVHEALKAAYDDTIAGWVGALDLRDKETEGHTQRVTHMTMDLARALGMRDEEMAHIRRGAFLHDVGKLGIPDSILQKQGKLTEEEMAVMRLHTIFAHDWLSHVEYLRPALEIPYSHHEKWDGTGYPLGLQGEEIPLSARCFAIADVWDALIHERPYKRAWTEEEALKYVTDNRGFHFDPHVVDVFLEYRKSREKSATPGDSPAGRP